MNKMTAVCVSLAILFQQEAFANSIDSKNKIGARAGIRVSAFPWFAPGIPAAKERLPLKYYPDDFEVLAGDLQGEKHIWDNKFIYSLPRQKALLTVTYTYLVLEPSTAEDKLEPDVLVLAALSGVRLPASFDTDNLRQALRSAFTSGKPLNLDDFCNTNIKIKISDAKKESDAEEDLRKNLRNLARTIRTNNKRAGISDDQLSLFATNSLESGSNAAPLSDGNTSDNGNSNTGGPATKPGGSTDVPALDINEITGMVSIDKPVSVKLIATPDRALRFLVDYSHADPLTSDIKQGQISINESGIITGINHEHVDQLPGIVSDVAVSALDIAKAVATWGASGLFAGTGGSTKMKTQQNPAKAKYLSLDFKKLDNGQKPENLVFTKLHKTVKMTTAFDIPVQKIVDLDFAAKYDLVELPQDFGDQVNEMLTEKGLNPVKVPKVVLTLRPTSSKQISFLNVCSLDILGKDYLDGIVVRRPQTIRFSVLTNNNPSFTSTPIFAAPGTFTAADASAAADINIPKKELAPSPEDLEAKAKSDLESAELKAQAKSKSEFAAKKDAITKHRSKSHKNDVDLTRDKQSKLAVAAEELESAHVVIVEAAKSTDLNVQSPGASQATAVAKSAICAQSSSRVLFDSYFQLAQTGSLAAISLRTKTGRDSAKSITLGAAGGVTSVDETTTSPLKAWTEVLKAIAGAL